MSKRDSYKDFRDLMLPPSVVTKLDLARMLSEVERVDNVLTTRAVRAKISKHQLPAPIMSAQLNDFLDLNDISLAQGGERSRLIKTLRVLKDKVPVVHMTFATTADPNSLGRLVSWVRDNGHPQTLLVVGIQPDLVAGVFIRTPNHIYDFSMRKTLEKSHSLLVEQLASSKIPAEAV